VVVSVSLSLPVSVWLEPLPLAGYGVCLCVYYIYTYLSTVHMLFFGQCANFRCEVQQSCPRIFVILHSVTG